MTTIQRQYSLPNCTLILEGFGDATQLNPAELRPVMVLLLSAECHLEGLIVPLKGDRTFFEHLVAAVSLYAQECLSGIHLPPHTYRDHPSQIQIKRVSDNLHELTYQPAATESGTTAQPQIIQMNTVQLFDLVEAIDQFVADTQTLPAWSLNLAPVPKKYAPREGTAQQAIPAALGLSSVAIAVLVFAAVPIPQIRQPKYLRPEPVPTASPSPTTSAPDLQGLQADIDKIPAITDPQAIAKLQQGLTDLLQQNFSAAAQISQPLTYKVSVGQDGKIIGYKDQSDAAAKESAKTPLARLLYRPVSGQPAAAAIASYQVTFQPDGSVQVAPWTTAQTPSPSPTPIASPTASPSAAPTPEASPSATPSPSPTAATANPVIEMTGSSDVEAIQPKLYDQINTAWKTTPPFNEDLKFRVRVNRDGKILDYEADNRAARDYVNETPLPQLGKSADPAVPPAESFAVFKVVFKPDGKLQVSPWRGYNP